ncbi:hypothetical protein ABFZ85_00475 [Hyphococcus formosus]|uniref:hypothetical protein n=1 Tax=Hyphococcus formosus TaxID=3143534 RepID=UPI00398A6330
MLFNLFSKDPSRPWYLGWKGAAALIVGLLAVSILTPSKSRTATIYGKRLYDFCINYGKEDKSEKPSESKIATCGCLQNKAVKHINEGGSKEEFGGAWFASTKLVCSTEAIMESLDNLETIEDDLDRQPETQPVILKTNSNASPRPTAREGSHQTFTPRGKHAKLFKRIQAGDYVWSKAFPKKDKALLGYAIALRESVDQYCPGTISAGHSINIEYFTGALQGDQIIDTLQGRKPIEFAELFAQSIIETPYYNTSRSHFTQMVKANGCDGAQTQALTTNLAHLLSGRRPAYTPKPQPTTLVVEKLSPIEAKHAYENKSGAALTSRGAKQLDHDFNQAKSAGMTLLECHYDEKPNDEWYHVQYYWGIGAVTSIGYLAPTFADAFQRSSQERITKANGRVYTHPFTTYGFPRLECPPIIDPALGSKKIYAPRKTVASDTSSAPIPTNPKITEKRMSVTYEYGPSPESFVPPIPKNLPNKTIYLSTEKQGAGSLSDIEIQSFGYWSLPRTDMDYANRPTQQATLQEDVKIISKQRPRVLVCKYLAERRGIAQVSRHWYMKAPKGTDRDRLRSRITDHPVLTIYEERENCPSRYVPPKD